MGRNASASKADRKENLGPGFVRTSEWSASDLAAMVREVGTAPAYAETADTIEQYGICGKVVYYY